MYSDEYVYVCIGTYFNQCYKKYIFRYIDMFIVVSKKLVKSITVLDLDCSLVVIVVDNGSPSSVVDDAQYWFLGVI